jgi:peptidoglycan hydrolase CwlO-like protein
MPVDVLFLNAVTFAIGIVLGMILYRVVWWVDSRDMQTEIKELQSYNSALQKQVVGLENRVAELQSRLDLVEDTNRELNRDYRRLADLRGNRGQS